MIINWGRKMKSSIKKIKTETQIKTLLEPIQNDSGIAMILVLLVLVILTFMGLSGLLTSSDEIILSGNFKGGRQTFFASEGGINYVFQDSNYFNQTSYAGEGSSYPGGFPRAGIDLCSNDTDATGAVSFMASGPPPVGSGTSVKTHKADYYTITSTGRGFVRGTVCGTEDGAQEQQSQVMGKILVKGSGT